MRVQIEVIIYLEKDPIGTFPSLAHNAQRLNYTDTALKEENAFKRLRGWIFRNRNRRNDPSAISESKSTMISKRNQRRNVISVSSKGFMQITLIINLDSDCE